MRGRLERIGIFYGNSGGVGENTGYFAFVHGGGCDRLSDRLDQDKVFFAGLELKTGLQGIIKKVMYFVMIGTAFLIGWGIKEMGAGAGLNLDFALLIGWYVTAVMLVNELTSILENLYVIMPEKVPVWLIKTLKIADETIEGKINDLVCKNQNCETCELKERCNLKKEGGTDEN